MIDSQALKQARQPANGYCQPGNIKGGSITVPLTSCLTGLESAVWQLTTRGTQPGGPNQGTQPGGPNQGDPTRGTQPGGPD